MKPWTEKKMLASALKNEHVHIGQRKTDVGTMRGIYATRGFAPGVMVASYHGRTISRDALRELHTSGPEGVALFERITMYGVETKAGEHLYTDSDDVGAHLINHSCQPNCMFAGMERGAMLVKSTRPIAEGQELVLHYGWVGVKAAVEKSWHLCACTAPYCAKTIELKFEYEELENNAFSMTLPIEEVCNRFLADIINGVSDHEEVLYRYGSSSQAMVIGAEAVSRVDVSEFVKKLRRGALQAISRAYHQDWPPNGARLGEVIRKYGREMDPRIVTIKTGKHGDLVGRSHSR